MGAVSIDNRCMDAKDEIDNQLANAEAAMHEEQLRQEESENEATRIAARKLRMTAHLPEIGTPLPKTRTAFRGPKRAGPMAKKAASKSLAKFGFEGGGIIRFWPEIAGERLATVTRPERIKRMPEGDVLVLKVANAAAMEVQHKMSELLERANQIAGSGKLARIEIIQGPIN